MTEEHILYEKLQKVHARNARKAERYERAYTGKEAQERIDLFLLRMEEQHGQDVGGKVDGVEYVKYP